MSSLSRVFVDLEKSKWPPLDCNKPFWQDVYSKMRRTYMTRLQRNSVEIIVLLCELYKPVLDRNLDLTASHASDALLLAARVHCDGLLLSEDYWTAMRIFEKELQAAKNRRAVREVGDFKPSALSRRQTAPPTGTSPSRQPTVKRRDTRLF